MGILKDICQDIFSVKNKYVGDFKFKIVRILGLKLSKSLGYQTKGKNNKIYIIENSVRKELKKCIYGHLHGKENFRRGLQGVKNGVAYSLVSLDYLDAKPKEVYTWEKK